MDASTALMRRALDAARLGPEADPNPRVGCVVTDADGPRRRRGPPPRRRHPARRGRRPAPPPGRPPAAAPPSSPSSPATTPAAPARAPAPARRRGAAASSYAVPDPEPGRRRGRGAPARRGRRRRGRACCADEAERAQRRVAAARRTRPPVRHAGSSRPPSTAGSPPPTGRAAGSPGRPPAPTRTPCAPRCDAIVVGTGTALADDPPLTVRDPRPAALAARQPLRVVVGQRDRPGRRPAARRRGPGPRAATPTTPPSCSTRCTARGIHHVLARGRPDARRRLPGAPGSSTRSSRLRRPGPARRGPRRRRRPRHHHHRRTPLRLRAHATSPSSTATSASRRPDRPAEGAEPLMFTGIVEELGTVAALEPRDRLGPAHASTDPLVTSRRGARRVDRASTASASPSPSHGDGTFTVDVMAETLRRSRAWAPARRRPRQPRAGDGRVGGRFGGHVVQGHVDGIGTILSRDAGRALGGRRDLACRPSSRATSSRRARSRSTASRSPSSHVGRRAASGLADPHDARGDDPRHQGRRRPRQPRGRRPGQVRRAAARRPARPQGGHGMTPPRHRRGRPRRPARRATGARRRRRRPRERGRRRPRRAVRDATSGSPGPSGTRRATCARRCTARDRRPRSTCR